jgi:hypothetical protein
MLLPMLVPHYGTSGNQIISGGNPERPEKEVCGYQQDI